jgi:hypothetical protein
MGGGFSVSEAYRPLGGRRTVASMTDVTGLDRNDLVNLARDMLKMAFSIPEGKDFTIVVRPDTATWSDRE